MNDEPFPMVIRKAVTKEVLSNPVDVQIGNENLTFASAKLIADQKATELASDPMLLGWYDSSTGRYSPKLECCSDHKPGWIVYAETRGGDITIDINNEQYVFIYRDLAL
jgi:hypothetical protein